ncbi:DUF4167 domain-containing protein [Oryzifoliimicrobium ureilyticus]|uniref:DUF4167 domain-containing protein n=1 Tax=Oryzifoliimicrobium ureilyticus TaxID=3113724 RepID=UPI0030762651
MRPGQQNKRGRGRGNNNNGGNNNNNFNRKGGNPLTRTYDSSGPDVKIRGTAQHIAEKYAQLARDAQSSGDRVIAENYLQHAEHYNRIIASAQAQMQERFQREERSDYQDRENIDRDGDDLDAGDLDDVVVVQPPRHQYNGNGQHQPRRDENRGQQDHQPRRQQEEQPRQVAAPAVAPQAEEEAAEQPPVVAERAPRQSSSERPARTRRNENRPAPAPKEEAPAAVASSVDGSGPQPDIAGIPAEVVMEDQAGEQPRERQTRRRSTGPRQRRPRRSEEGEASEPALADVASE